MLTIVAVALTNVAIAQSVWSLPDDVQPQKATSFAVVFGEGPVWHPNGFLLFIDLNGNTILHFDPAEPTDWSSTPTRI